MELIWEYPADQGIMVREIFKVLYKRRELAYTTIMSTMARLAKKHLLRVEKQEQAYLYYPIYTRQEFVSRFVGRILEDLLVSFSDVTFANIDALRDPEAVAQARRWLDEIARRREEEEDE